MFKPHIWCLIKRRPGQVSAVSSPAKRGGTARSAGKNVKCVVCSGCSTNVSSASSFPLTEAGGLLSEDLRLTSRGPSRPVRCCLFVLLSDVAHPFEKTMKAAVVAPEKYTFPKQIQIQLQGSHRHHLQDKIRPKRVKYIWQSKWNDYLLCKGNYHSIPIATFPVLLK